MDSNYPISKILSSFRNAKVGINEVDGGYESGIIIETIGFSESDISLLDEHLKGELKDGRYFLWVKNNKRERILFDNEEAAAATCKSQIPHLEKKLLFSIFTKTGVSLVQPKESVVNFIRKV